jgi:PLP dependent protein
MIRTQVEMLKKTLKPGVMLVAVSKTRTPAEIREAAEAGVQDFGENYLQEALPKIQILQDLPLTWHFIGPIQSNKTKRIATYFSWVHSVCDLRIAEQLNRHRPEHLPPLNICIQVNIDNEPTKSGMPLENIESVITPILSLSRLRLRGLMIIPKPQHTSGKNNPFLKTATLLKKINDTYHLHLDTLSMGMSDDFEQAIQAGSTCVRIGTKLFGKRQPY